MIPKEFLIKEIIRLKIFKVAESAFEKNWILLKNRSRAPVFLDTSVFISHPVLLDNINKYTIQTIKNKKIQFDKIIGLPYGGLPFSYGISFILKKPALVIRKEGKKNYSTAGDLLGKFKKGEKILIIEDAIVTAKTAIGFIKRLKKDKLVVSDLISIVDVGKDGAKNLKKEGVTLHVLFTWKDLFEVYKKMNHKIPLELKEKIEKILN